MRPERAKALVIKYFFHDAYALLPFQGDHYCMRHTQGVALGCGLLGPSARCIVESNPFAYISIFDTPSQNIVETKRPNETRKKTHGGWNNMPRGGMQCRTPAETM